ncbi:MAG: cell wall-binding repeat-containing protein [Actinobacteria bacterium]|nr:cell wall-binding repeat-containing protein [Actinomycetota bacterium]
MRSPTSTRTPRGRRLLAAALGIITALALAVPSWGLPAAEVEASTSTGAHWVAQQVAANGAVTNGFSGEVGNAVQAALALAAAGEGGDAFDRALRYVRENYDGYVNDGTGDNPGALGYVALLADAAGDDPTSFGTAGNESDLVQRIRDTRQTTGPDEGQYGTGTVFDRVFNHSLGLLGLATVGATPHQSAMDWLREQQCPDGGWPSYRSEAQRQAGTCELAVDDTDAVTSTTPDSNSTSLAAMALVAHGVDSAHDTTSWFRTHQNDDGGWGFSPAFGATDSNSTALVIQALVAIGAPPTTGPWLDIDQDSPLTALRQLQLGCEAEPAERGAFAFQPDDDGNLQPNGAATYAAVIGMQRVPYLTLSFPAESRTAVPSTSEPSCPDLAVERDGGEDRIATSVELALDTYPSGADTVVIARAFGYADALAGGPLAADLDAPILLSHTDELPQEVILAIDQLGATDAVMLGETEALSEAVRATLEDDLGLNVTRVGGDTRFHTAADIARILGGDEVYVTEGVDPDPSRGWPDAVSVSPLASFQQRPILLVSTETLPDATAAVLDGRSATIIGGEVAVSEQVEEAIDDATGKAVARIAGEDRYRTSLAVSRVARDAGMDPATSWVATGEKFPDALAAGPAIAVRGGVLILVASSGVPSATADYVHEVNLVLDGFHLVGGEVVIPPAVVDGLVAEARGS